MYIAGNDYFKLIPICGQSASCFNLGNQYWRRIALDALWCERGGDTPASSRGELVDVEIEWLKAKIQHAQSFNPPAQVVLLTHHQLFWAFDGTDLGQVLLGQLKPFLDTGNIYTWFWGDGHRGIVYASNATYNFKACCIGHEGFPYSPSTDSPGMVRPSRLLGRAAVRAQQCMVRHAWLCASRLCRSEREDRLHRPNGGSVYSERNL